VSLPASCSVEALAEWLRSTTVTRVQRFDPANLRPFAESGRREAWVECAQDLRALVEAKCAEAVREGTYLGGDGRPYGADITAIVSRILGAP
jgi:hypothetical protein